MLKELAEETEDEPLRQEIKERLAFDERCFFLFQQNDGNYFFQVRENASAFTEPSGNFAPWRLLYPTPRATIRSSILPSTKSSNELSTRRSLSFIRIHA